MSEATILPSGPTNFAATCDHPPGAAPRSTTIKPGLKILSFWLISINL